MDLLSAAERLLAVTGGGDRLAFSAADPEQREKVALRTVAIAFFALAAYVAVESRHRHSRRLLR